MWKPRGNPALTTIAFVVGVAASAALLRWITQLGSETDQTLADSGRFQAWIGVAAFAVVAFVDTFIAGERALRSMPTDPSSPSLMAYTGLFVLFAVIVLAVLWAGARGGPEVSVGYWAPIRVGLVLLAVVAAGPWVISVWSSHGVLSQHRLHIPELAAVDSSAAAGLADLEHTMHLLLGIRRNIADAVGRLLVLVLAAVLLSGALHAALVPAFIQEDEFPASAVLAYGAFFTVMLSLAVLPSCSPGGGPRRCCSTRPTRRESSLAPTTRQPGPVFRTSSASTARFLRPPWLSAVCWRRWSPVSSQSSSLSWANRQGACRPSDPGEPLDLWQQAADAARHMSPALKPVERLTSERQTSRWSARPRTAA